MTVALDARLLPKLNSDTVIELMRLAPGVRGFWTDDELLADARLSSLPMLKKLQTIGWVMPGHIPVEGGGRRRAWVLREVVRAALAAELARITNLAVLGVATLLQSVPSGWMEDALSMEALIAFAEGSGKGLPPQSRAMRICVVDMSEAWLEREPGEFQLLSQDLVISGADMKAPRYREARRSTQAEGLLTGERAAVLMLNPSRVSLAFVGTVARARHDWPSTMG